jgi:hypothetical protein
MLLEISIEGGADKGENVAQEKTFRRNMRFFGIRWRLFAEFVVTLPSQMNNSE